MNNKKRPVGIASVLLCITVILGAQEEVPFDTTQEDWDYKAMTELEWMMDMIDCHPDPLVAFSITQPVEADDPDVFPEGDIGYSEHENPYRIYLPENNEVEYYAYLMEDINRSVALRQADGSVFLDNNFHAEGVLAYRQDPQDSQWFLRKILRWPIQYKDIPKDDPFAKYTNGIPQVLRTMFYPNIGWFHEMENTLAGLHETRREEYEPELVKRLPNEDWRLSLSLAGTRALGYGYSFESFIKRIEPGVWESDGAFGARYRLIFEPENRRIHLVWENKTWKGFPMMNFYLYPLYDMYERGHLPPAFDIFEHSPAVDRK